MWRALCFVLLLPGAAWGQSQAETLADMRQELAVLSVELQQLNRELSTSGAGQVQISGTALARLTAIETELSRLTGQVEALDHRIQSIVKDGTNRISDLEFRLLELEGGDLSKLGQTLPLGGVEAAPPPRSAPTGPQLAVGEQADFDRAMAAFNSGDMEGAINLLSAFTRNYSGGELVARAYFHLGDALVQQGRRNDAARAYLDSFTTAPEGPVAPAALLNLGQGLADLGQLQEACVTLDQVSVRFATAPEAAAAQAKVQQLQCR
jgi:tol-pal system protein YbgF